MSFFHHYYQCQEARPAIFEEDVQRGSENWEMDEMRKQYFVEKYNIVVKNRECELWTFYKTEVSVKYN